MAVLRGRIAWWLYSDRVWRAYHATGVAEVGEWDLGVIRVWLLFGGFSCPSGESHVEGEGGVAGGVYWMSEGRQLLSTVCTELSEGRQLLSSV